MLSYRSKLNKMEYTFLKDKILFNKVLDAVPKKLFHTLYGEQWRTYKYQEEFD